MTCVKTGCHIYIEPYQEYAYGDAFEIEPWLPSISAKMLRELSCNGYLSDIKDIAYFHLVGRSMTPINGLLEVHYTIHDYADWFGKDTNRSFLITNNFTKETRKNPT